MKKRFLFATCVAWALPMLAFAEELGEEVADAAAAEGGGLLTKPIIPSMTEFIPMLIIFAILVVILAKFGWPMILGILDTRAEKIEGSLKGAEAAKVEAEDILAQYQQKLVDARTEAAGIVAEGRAAGEATKADIIARAETEAKDIIAKARITIDAEKIAAEAELKKKTAAIALAVAGKVIGEKLTPEADGQLVDKYIADLGSFNG
jgi:F-type H+-transporting ATPase subunit b